MGGDHSYRASSQKDTDGAGNDGSLNAPIGIPNRVEPVSRVQQTVAPQVGRKWWLIRVPALFVRVYTSLGPFRRTVSPENTLCWSMARLLGGSRHNRCLL